MLLYILCSISVHPYTLCILNPTPYTLYIPTHLCPCALPPPGARGDYLTPYLPHDVLLATGSTTERPLTTEEIADVRHKCLADAQVRVGGVVEGGWGVFVEYLCGEHMCLSHANIVLLVLYVVCMLTSTVGVLLHVQLHTLYHHICIITYIVHVPTQ